MIPEHDQVEQLSKTSNKNIGLLVEEMTRVRINIAHVPSDIIINDPKVSKTHAVLTRYDDGSWSISNVHRGGDIQVNGKKMDMGVACS